MPRPESWIRIRSPALSADIDPLGAQLSTLRDAEGRDLLWDGDPAFWSGRAPLLFPIVGALAGGHYRLGDRRYALPRHGFARVSAFEIVDQQESCAAFLLRAGEQTRQNYPFDFELLARYALNAATLQIRVQIRNIGQVPLAASLGFHPAFRWPLPFGYARSEHCLAFAADEVRYARRLDAQGLLTDERHPIPLEARRLALTDALFTQDALIFEKLRSEWVRFGAAEGPQLEVSLLGAPYLGVWTKPGAGFLCIEPWHGIADPEGFAGDLFEKPGILTVAPGLERTIGMDVRLC